MPQLQTTQSRPAIADPPLSGPLLSVEALTSAGTNLLVTAIFFYTANQFHWGLLQNFELATAQGAIYIVGALSAHPFARWLNHRRALAVIYGAMSAVCFLGWRASAHPLAFAGLLLAYNGIASVGWPIIESLFSTDVHAAALSRRISIYNLVWSAVGAIMLAIDGALIEHWRAGVLLLPAIMHAISAAIMLRESECSGAPIPSVIDEGGSPRVCNRQNPRASDPGYECDSVIPNIRCNEPPEVPSDIARPTLVLSADDSTAVAEPELLRVRTLALWLSRVALPASYVVLYSLMALMPSLPLFKTFSPATQTLVGSTWMVSRWLAFLVLGLTNWWHSRPQLLLFAAVVMLVSFFGITLRVSDFIPHGSASVDLCVMLIAQLALGGAIGVIYSASLYFGMALSEGSTEHGGYHEALIGVGFMVGPGVGAIAEAARPGNAYVGIFAVGSVIFLSVAAVAVTAYLGHRKTPAGR